MGILTHKDISRRIKDKFRTKEKWMLEKGNHRIHSSLASDVDFADLVQEFVYELPNHQKAIRDFMAGGDQEGVQRILHQLRGACGGYGFQQLTNAAGEIEDKLRAGATLKNVTPILMDFTSSLSRVTADPEKP
jgi:HPt (histidine-containing phosphotransfer) domain-containing protein